MNWKWCAYPSIFLDGLRETISRVKWLVLGADHLPVSSAKIKNVWTYTSTLYMSLWHGA